MKDWTLLKTDIITREGEGTVEDRLIKCVYDMMNGIELQAFISMSVKTQRTAYNFRVKLEEDKNTVVVFLFVKYD